MDACIFVYSALTYAAIPSNWMWPDSLSICVNPHGLVVFHCHRTDSDTHYCLTHFPMVVIVLTVDTPPPRDTAADYHTWYLCFCSPAVLLCLSASSH